MVLRYTATALREAARPIPLTIGRASSRRGWRWVTAQWVRHVRTWVLPPLSCEQMLELQSTRHDLAKYLQTMERVLRALLPHRWWYRVTGDPVALVLRLPPALISIVLRELVTTPGTGLDGTQEDSDGLAELTRLQRRAAHGGDAEAGPVPTLAMAALACRTALGEAWYRSPHWPTTDGTPPFGVVWVTFAGLEALRAQRVLERVDAHAVVHAKHPARRLRQLQQVAFPHEVH